MKKNKKGLTKNETLYVVFVVFIAVALIITSFLEKRYTQNLEEEYNVNKEQGEYLVQCEDGTYDIANPNKLKMLCSKNDVSIDLTS